MLTAVEDGGHHQFTQDLSAWKSVVLAAFTHNELTHIDNTIVSNAIRISFSQPPTPISPFGSMLALRS